MILLIQSRTSSPWIRVLHISRELHLLVRLSAEDSDGSTSTILLRAFVVSIVFSGNVEVSVPDLFCYHICKLLQSVAYHHHPKHKAG